MILITGGMGFIGLNTAKRFIDAGEEVVLTQHHARREPDYLKEEVGKRVTVETLDVTNTYDVLDIVQRHGVTGIVHLAAPPPRGAVPRQDFQIYGVGLLNILEAGRLFNLKRVALSSSTAVYGGLAEGPWREDALLPMDSRNQIEAFKKSTEILAQHYADRTGVDLVLLRMSNIWGPFYYTMNHSVSRMCLGAALGVEADFSRTPVGTPCEEDEVDLCYVKDCARAIHLLMQADALSHRIYNIGAGCGWKHREVADAVRKAVPGTKISLSPGNSPQAKKDPYLDLTRIRQDVGFEPEYDIERAVADYIAWLRDHPGYAMAA